jgi:hypothetical protein
LDQIVASYSMARAASWMGVVRLPAGSDLSGQIEGDLKVAWPRLQEVGGRKVEPLLYMGHCGLRRHQVPKDLRGDRDAEEAEDRRPGQGHFVGAVERVLSPPPSLLMLGERGDSGVERQVDVDDDHASRRTLARMASSSSSSARRLKPCRSSPGRRVDSWGVAVNRSAGLAGGRTRARRSARPVQRSSLRCAAALGGCRR